jgi:Domain of unknown function (DUF3332)
MKHTLKSIVCALLLTGMLAGCYGSFNLTRKVWKWNGGVGDKWVNELVFLVINIVPVYGAAAFIDVVVLNTVEFWDGKNPVTSENALPTNIKGDEGTTVTFNSQEKVMEITRMIPGRGQTTYRVARENGQSVVMDKDNNILVRCIAGDDGEMTLLDAQGKVLHSYSRTQAEALAMH